MSDLYFTSLLYPLLTVESLMASSHIVGGRLFTPPAPLDSVQPAAALTGGLLHLILQQYSYWTPEAVRPSAALSGGALVTILKQYPYWIPEAVQPTSVALVGGALTKLLVAYSYYPAEGLRPSAAITGGSLT